MLKCSGYKIRVNILNKPIKEDISLLSIFCIKYRLLNIYTGAAIFFVSQVALKAYPFLVRNLYSKNEMFAEKENGCFSIFEKECFPYMENGIGDNFYKG